MAEKDPTWVLLHGKVWSVIPGSFGQECKGVQNTRRIFVKYVYNLSTKRDSSERHLLWRGHEISHFKNEDQNLFEIETAKQTILQNDNYDNRHISTDSGYPASNSDSFVDEEGLDSFFVSERANELYNISEENCFSSTRLEVQKQNSEKSIDLKKDEAHFFTPKKLGTTTFREHNYSTPKFQEKNIVEMSRGAKKKGQSKKFSSYHPGIELDQNQSQMESQSRGLIVKYKYFLSVNRDGDGNPIAWQQRNHLVFDSNNLRTKREVASERLQDATLLKYEYVTDSENFSDYSKKNKELERTFKTPFSISLKDATVYTPESLSFDEDLRDLLPCSLTKSSQVECTSDFANYCQKRSDSMSSGYNSICQSSVFDCSTADDVIIEEQSDKLMKCGSVSSRENVKNTDWTRYASEERRNAKKKQEFSPFRIERVTFKAWYGYLPYFAVFRLDDDIRNLKTFIHLISGLPPNRQRYFAISGSKRADKKKTLRHLGFKDGDIVHLEVKES